MLEARRDVSNPLFVFSTLSDMNKNFRSAIVCVDIHLSEEEPVD